jgi:hypothetical protein
LHSECSSNQEKYVYKQDANTPLARLGKQRPALHQE